MVKHCRTKRHIKIKSYENVSVTGRMYVSCFGREGEGKSWFGINISLKMCCVWGKALRLWQFEGDFKNVRDLCEILCKMCHKLLQGAEQVSYSEVTPEVFLNSSVWILQVSLQTGTCKIYYVP